MATNDQLVPFHLKEPHVFSKEEYPDKKSDEADLSDDDHQTISHSPLAKNLKSYGVQKAEGISKWMSTKYIWTVFGFIALTGYWMGLNQYLEGTYETEALSVSFKAHTLIATINTAQGLIQAASQPPLAKICDLVGRFETYFGCLFLYVIGNIIVATAQNLQTYAGGMIINTFGIAGFWLVTQVIIADNTSTRSRLFWSIFPSLPGCINVWVSGDIAQAIIPGLGWRFGFAMFTFVMPIVMGPCIALLYWAQRKARQLGYLDHAVAPWTGGNLKSTTVKSFWQIDLVGLLLMVAAYALILIPMTLARASGNSWSDPFVPGMMVPGGALLVAFFIWEAKFAKHPILPFKLLRNRTLICCFLLSLIHPLAGSIQGNYLFTWYRVAADQSIKSATRLSNLGFLGTLVTSATGLLVVKIPYLKPFIVFGVCLNTMTLGLMSRFRGRSNSIVELAAMQVLKGVANGLVAFPVQAAVQSVCSHEHLALITSAWLSIYYIGRAVGSAIGGAIWGSQLPGRLLEAVNGDQALANSIYRNPIGWIGKNGFDNPLRERVAIAYSDGQRYILIAAASVAGLTIIIACCLENVKLSNTVTLAQYETEGEVVVPGQGAKEQEKPQKAVV